jgi:hypothetical protein
VVRHAHATHLLTESVPVHVAVARVGDDPNTLLSTYAHLLPQSDEVAAAKVASLLSRSPHARWHVVSKRNANPHGCVRTAQAITMQALSR